MRDGLRVRANRRGYAYETPLNGTLRVNGTASESQDKNEISEEKNQSSWSPSKLNFGSKFYQQLALDFRKT